MTKNMSFYIQPDTINPKGDVSQQLTAMRRSDAPASYEMSLWPYIRNKCNTISFNNYNILISTTVEQGKISQNPDKENSFMRSPFPGVNRYQLLKTATEVWLMIQCGVYNPNQSLEDYPTLKIIDEESRMQKHITQKVLEDWWSDYLDPISYSSGHRKTLPYLDMIRIKLKDMPLNQADLEQASSCYGIIEEKLTSPLLMELIWSYWHEEAMLVQTINAISLRFQNKRNSSACNVLANLELDPLRAMNSLLWGYVQDEQHRLSVNRRAYEYDHQYGLRLYGKAIPELHTADPRSKFLEAFHNLLYLCSVFYKEDDDTNIVSDAFPVLNSLKECHFILTQGAHNQYGDLVWTSRMEMLMEEWLIARPEIREFLPGRIMVAYPELWMERVEAMKKLQGWSDTPVVHFRDLGVFGEQILLGIRYHKWSEETLPNTAKNWARYWRPEIQGYIHAYRAVTGVDLTCENPDCTLPSIHLHKRLGEQLRSSMTRSDLQHAQKMGILN
jgi:hypothetical protein